MDMVSPHSHYSTSGEEEQDVNRRGESEQQRGRRDAEPVRTVARGSHAYPITGTTKLRRAQEGAGGECGAVHTRRRARRPGIAHEGRGGVAGEGVLQGCWGAAAAGGRAYLQVQPQLTRMMVTSSTGYARPRLEPRPRAGAVGAGLRRTLMAPAGS